MSWEDHAAEMDAIVDAELGDAVEWAADGSSFKCIDAFVIPQLEVLGMDGIDSPLGSRHRLKVSKTIIPKIENAHRFRGARMGEGTFKNGSDTIDEDGRYWIFDLIKAP